MRQLTDDVPAAASEAEPGQEDQGIDRRKGRVLGLLGSLVAMGGVPFGVIAEEEAAWEPAMVCIAALVVGTRLVVAGARKIDSAH